MTLQGGAVIIAARLWCYWIYGRKYSVRTDHASLTGHLLSAITVLALIMQLALLLLFLYVGKKGTHYV